jgi:hypothetical protein
MLKFLSRADSLVSLTPDKSYIIQVVESKYYFFSLYLEILTNWIPRLLCAKAVMLVFQS